jgi:hypothetical protein
VLLFLKTMAAIAAMSMVIPLYIWGASGSWRHGLHAWKQWALIMGVIALVGGGLGALASLLS